MGIDPLESAWESYRGAIESFYAIVLPALEDERRLDDDEIEPADAALGAAADASAALGDAYLTVLDGRSNRNYNEIATLLLAAAALDMMLAHDGLRLDPEVLPADEQFTESAGLAEREQEPRDEMFAAARYLFEGFLGIAGAADPANPAQLRGVCLEAVDTLVNAATRPALRFSFNPLTLGAEFAVSGAISQLDGLIAHSGLIRRHALRLAAQGPAPDRLDLLRSCTGAEQRQMMRLQARPMLRGARRWLCPRARAWA